MGGIHARDENDARWDRLDVGRRWVQFAAIAVLVSLFTTAVVATVSLVAVVTYAPTALLLVLILAAPLGLLGMYRTMEFKCPRCSKRYQHAGDLIGPWIFTRAKCHACGLRYRQALTHTSSPSGAD